MGRSSPGASLSDKAGRELERRVYQITSVAREGFRGV